MSSGQFFRWFDEITITDLPLVGGKNASLGEMVKNLRGEKITIPFGFALTTQAFKNFLQHNRISDEIYGVLRNIDTKNLVELTRASVSIRSTIANAVLHDEIAMTLKQYYETLKNNREPFRVAVRSSASAEDLPHASFAGQQDTYLHVPTFEMVLTRIKDVYASLFSERAIAYRAHHHFDHENVTMSVGIQEMVNSDHGTSGVMFSIDPESGFKDAIFVNASYGLGESVVSGAVNPDEYMLYKPAISDDRLVVLSRTTGSKAKKMIFDAKSQNVIAVDVEENIQKKFALGEKDLKTLAHCAYAIEQHYHRPMDIEWAQDGNTKQIYILQARPETIHGQKNSAVSETYFLKEQGEVLCEGRAVGKRIGQGRARLLKNIAEAHDFCSGDILVTDMTDPNWEPIMEKAQAIVTNRGGRTCHAAIIARELGIPAVVGCQDATEKIANDALVTVSCVNGDTGQIYSGLLPIGKREEKLTDKKIATPLMLIAANPSRALSYHNLPHQGIGLARLEFIIAHSIGIHPNAILNCSTLPQEIRTQIEQRVGAFASPIDFYIDTLAMGIQTLAAVAHPHPIIVRFSDFKSNEYEELIGGQLFEPKENNPMIGFRGASRYISDLFKDAFALECRAVKKARDAGFKNIQPMIPFVRTLSEAHQVIDVLEQHGLKRGDDDLKIIMMCEIPSNVILADQFLDLFDGFSIGSNDLTQLTLGIDRDSHLVAGSFSESDPAMIKMLEMVIAACKQRGKYLGICGQGPSDNVKLAQWLIAHGIDSISVTPDTIADVHLALYDALSL